MYYSYIEIEYVATSFSPARTDLALKLLTLTCFQAGKLCHLVRTFHDPNYQELSNIMQTNPLNPIDDKRKKPDSMN
jgi:hypothetical protein